MMKKKSLNKRYQTSYESKESGNSGSRKGIFNFKQLESEVTFFKPQEGKNHINIIPYEIKTKNHPLVKKGDFEVGDMDYVMDIYTHRNVGPSESSVICLKNTYGKPCPICEQMALLQKQGKEEESKALKPSRRVIYNIEDLKEPGKIKMFETSHFLFEKELIDEARDDEEGGFVDFADVQEGKEIKFRACKTSLGGREFMEFKSFGFEERDEEISNKLLKQAISFDEIMNVPTYEEVEKILFGQEDDDKFNKKDTINDDEKQEETAVKKSSKKVVEEQEDDEDSEDEEQEETPVKKSCNCEKDCNNDKCPFAHNFGKDTDNFDDCNDCDVWDKCVNASD